MRHVGVTPVPGWSGTSRSGCLSAPARILRSIELALDCAPGLTLTQFLVFLVVADAEGIRLKDLGTRIGVSQAVTSRNVRALIPADEPGALHPAHGLLTLMRDRYDGRGRRAALSPSGRALLVRIECALEG